MASNKKITDLDEISSITVADDDVLAIVDVSQDKTYKIRKDSFVTAISGVTSIATSSPLSNNASTGSVTLTLNTVPVTKGGTGGITASEARTNLGLGSIATQDASSVAITGGTATLSSATVTSADVNGGTIDGTPIGSSSASTGAFTTLSASGGITGALTGNVTGNLTGNVTGDVTGDITGGVTGDVTGNLTGNVTSSGTSTFTTTTHSGTTTFNEDVTLTGDSYNAVWDKSDNRLEFADNAKVSWGSGSDLQIYHDGTNSVIHDSGTGDLTIRGTNLKLQPAAGTEDFLTATTNAEVTLYYNNNAKLSTTSTGISVTGDVNFTGDLKENGSVYKPSFTGAVLEELHSLCNTTSLKGRATIENVTTYQDLDSTYTDVTGSKVSAYTCPTGTSEIVYEFNPEITSSGSVVISHWKLYYSTNGTSWTEVTKARAGLGAGSYGQQKFPIRWVFKVNAGSDDSTVGQFSAATPTLYFKWQAREYSASYPGRIHGTFYWDGVSSNEFSLPSVCIKAIA